MSKRPNTEGLVHRDPKHGSLEKPKEPQVWKSQVAREIHDLKPHIHPPVPNPAPLGLIAFGLTTALLQLKHTRIGGETQDDLEGVDNVVLGFAIFFGGLLQIIAGISEIRRNNIFGYTAFCLFGGLWMSIGTVDIVSLLSPGGVPPLNAKASQAFLFMSSVFTYMLWVLTFKMNKTICSLFFLLGTTLVLLCFGVRNELCDKIGGWFGIITSVNAYWLAFAELVNDVIGEGKKELIPLGHWHWKKAAEESVVASTGAYHVFGRIHGTRFFNKSAAAGADVGVHEEEDHDIEEGTDEASAN